MALIAVLLLGAIAIWRAPFARGQPSMRLSALGSRLSALALATWAVGVLGHVGAQSGWGTSWQTVSLTAYLLTSLIACVWFVRRRQHRVEKRR